MLSRAWVAQWVKWLDYLTTHTSLSPIRCGFAPGFVNYKKGCTRLAAASDKVYQLLAHGQWFSPGTPTSSSTKTGRHDIAWNIAETGIKTPKINQSVKWSPLFIQLTCNTFFHILPHSFSYPTDMHLHFVYFSRIWFILGCKMVVFHTWQVVQIVK